MGRFENRHRVYLENCLARNLYERNNYEEIFLQEISEYHLTCGAHYGLQGALSSAYNRKTGVQILPYSRWHLS